MHLHLLPIFVYLNKLTLCVTIILFIALLTFSIFLAVLYYFCCAKIMDYCFSKCILQTILCVTILSMIDEIEGNNSICGNISFFDCINTFNMKTIDTYNRNCLLTMVKLIQDSSDLDNYNIIDIKIYYYTILRSFTDTYDKYESFKSQLWNHFIYVIGESSTTGIRKTNFFENLNFYWTSQNLDAEEMLNGSNLIHTYRYCNQTLKTLAEPSNVVNETGISNIKENIEAYGYNTHPLDLPITTFFGFILFLMKEDEVPSFDIMDIAPKLNFILEIMYDGLFDIVRGLIKILYKSNLIRLKDGYQVDDNEVINVDALKKVFLRAVETAETLFAYRYESILEQKSSKSKSLHTANSPFKYRILSEKKMEDGKTPVIPEYFNTYMNQMNNYWMKIEGSHNEDEELNGRLFIGNKVQPSILQYYSIINTWPTPIKITSETNDMEELLMELNGWLESIYYIVMNHRFKKFYKQYDDLKQHQLIMKTHKALINGLFNLSIRS